MIRSTVFVALSLVILTPFARAGLFGDTNGAEIIQKAVDRELEFSQSTDLTASEIGEPMSDRLRRELGAADEDLRRAAERFKKDTSDYKSGIAFQGQLHLHRGRVAQLREELFMARISKLEALLTQCNVTTATKKCSIKSEKKVRTISPKSAN